MRSLIASLVIVFAGCTNGTYDGGPAVPDPADQDPVDPVDDPADPADPPADPDPPPPAPPPTGRVTEGLQALYEFEEGIGPIVHDTSNVGTPLDLTVTYAGLITWSPQGLRIDASNILRTKAPATKIITACMASNEITLEAWVTPATADTGGVVTRIMGVSIDPQTRNFSLVQPNANYEFRLRTGATNTNGTPATVATGQVTTQPQHVVYTRDAAGNTRIYVDGVEKVTGTTADTFANWDLTYELALANELTMDRPWLGTYHLAAVYCKRLTPDEVKRNFDEKY